jgi:nicotinamide mononucleotide transporter
LKINGRVFLNAYKDVSLIHIVLEFIAFVFGILSVWYARSENILVYPTGLIATVITVYLLFIAGYRDMMINGYFTIMSIYGWYKWTRKVKGRDNQSKDEQQRKNNRDRIVFYYNFVVFSIYRFFDYQINVDNYIDIIASIFFTGCGIWPTKNRKLDPLDYGI